MLNEKQFYEGRTNLLIYRKEDRDTDFLIRVLSEVFISTRKENPADFARNLYAAFPGDTFFRLPGRKGYGQAYLPMDEVQTQQRSRILMNQTSAHMNFIQGTDFPCRGFLVDIESRQLHLIRGNDHIKQVNCSLNEGQACFYEDIPAAVYPLLFPFKRDHTYSLDALPSFYKFESDMAQSADLYNDEVR
jgi:hypothetical protein